MAGVERVYLKCTHIHHLIRIRRSLFPIISFKYAIILDKKVYYTDISETGRWGRLDVVSNLHRGRRTRSACYCLPRPSHCMRAKETCHCLTQKSSESLRNSMDVFSLLIAFYWYIICTLEIHPSRCRGQPITFIHFLMRLVSILNVGKGLLSAYSSYSASTSLQKV